MLSDTAPQPYRTARSCGTRAPANAGTPHYPYPPPTIHLRTTLHRTGQPDLAAGVLELFEAFDHPTSVVLQPVGLVEYDELPLVLVLVVDPSPIIAFRVVHEVIYLVATRVVGGDDNLDPASLCLFL